MLLLFSSEDRNCLKHNTYTCDIHIDMALSPFRLTKTAEEEVNLVQTAVPKSTQYKNKWAYGIFEEWQRRRLVKVPIVKVVGLLKNYDYHHVGVVSLIFKLG